MSTQTALADASQTALDPVYRASEVIFGLLMAMSFIGSISVATDGREEVRTLLVAALGCNLAWGLVDAVMLLVAVKTEKRRNRVLLAKLHGLAAITGFRDELEPFFFQKDTQTLAEHFMVVRDQYSNCHLQTP